MGLAASRQEAFWESCGFGNIERARHFLKAGDIDVNWVSYTNDCCPIHVASQGKPEIVQLLLEHNCDVNVRDNRGNLPLHHAAMKGHADIVQTLIDAGCEINAQEKNGWTALHNAAYWCRPEVVGVLIKNGCDVHVQNKDERTALHECARSQSGDDKKLGQIAQRLIDAGCDIHDKSSDWGEADLTGLMYASFHNHPDVASALIQAGCELNSVGTTFWTALHWAADRGNDELVYILLDAGIDPTIRDMRGDTAADRAQSDDIREFIATAVDIQKDLNRVKNPVIRPAVLLRKPEEPFKPKCDASFKSESFLPKDWKPSNPVNVKNLINEKKSRLAAMTSQKYRSELARRTGTGVIKDGDVKKSEDIDLNDSSDVDVKKSEDIDTNVKKSGVNETGDNKETEKMQEKEADDSVLNCDIEKNSGSGDEHDNSEDDHVTQKEKEGIIEDHIGDHGVNVHVTEETVSETVTEFEDKNENFEESNKCISEMKEDTVEGNVTDKSEGVDSRPDCCRETSAETGQTNDGADELLELVDSNREHTDETTVSDTKTDENQTAVANEMGDASNTIDDAEK